MNPYQYRRRPRGLRGSCIVALIVLIVAGGGIGFFIYRGITGDIITLAPHALIALESCSSVHVIGSERQTIAIQNNLGSVTKEIDGNALYLKGRGCFEVTLLVPTTSNLLLNASGNIDIFGVTGEMRLTGGSITVVQSTVEGKSKLEGNDTLFFQGELGQQSEISISGGSAPIDVELPKTAAFTLNVTGSFQSFNATFEGIPLKVQDAHATAEIHTQVGAHPQSKLNIQGSGTTVLLTGI